MKARHVGLCLGGFLVSAAVSNHAKSEQIPGIDRPHERFVALSDRVYGSDGSRGAVVGPAVDHELPRRMAGEAKGVSGGDTAASEARADDGSSRAPVCVAQHVSLLQAYRIRPPWRVAGVDYCVGYPDNVAFKDPAGITIAGTSVNETKRTISVTGNNVILDGYDFSLNGGWQLSVQGDNTRVVNSNFKVGSNDLAPIISTATASNLTVAYCTIDGDNRDPGPWGGLISYRGHSLTVEYSSLKNSGGDMIQQIDGGGGSTITVRNNLIENGGMLPGAHGDYTQLAGGPFLVAFNYNTTLQNGGSTQGLMTEFVSQGEIDHNTMIGTVSYFVSVDLSSITTVFKIYDNYFDPKGYGFAYPSNKTGLPNDRSERTIFRNNVNMRTGAVLQDAVGR